MTCNVKVKFRAQSVPPPHRLYFPSQAQTTIKTFGWHKKILKSYDKQTITLTLSTVWDTVPGNKQNVGFETRTILNFNCQVPGRNWIKTRGFGVRGGGWKLLSSSGKNFSPLISGTSFANKKTLVSSTKGRQAFSQVFVLKTYQTAL